MSLSDETIETICGYLNTDMRMHMESSGKWHLDPGKLRTAIDEATRDEAPAADFKSGDLVVLKSGGPVMTIIDASHMRCVCGHFSGITYLTVVLPPAVLRRHTATEAQAVEAGE